MTSLGCRNNNCYQLWYARPPPRRHTPLPGTPSVFLNEHRLSHLARGKGVEGSAMERRSRAKVERPPPPSSPAVSKTMKANKGKDTGPEMVLRRGLWQTGLRGYRTHWRRVPGSPEMAYLRRKLAIFVHGCFWHHCPWCDFPMPKSNAGYWLRKFELNKDRDRRKREALEEAGWMVLRFWDHQVRDDVAGCVETVRKALELEESAPR